MGEINTNQLIWNEMKISGISAKSLLNLDQGSFKMVKLAPGAEYPLHRHPDKSEFVYVLEGTLKATIDDSIFIGEKGMFYPFPVGSKHGLANPGKVETILLVGAIGDKKQ